MKKPRQKSIHKKVLLSGNREVGNGYWSRGAARRSTEARKRERERKRLLFSASGRVNEHLKNKAQLPCPLSALSSQARSSLRSDHILLISLSLSLSLVPLTLRSILHSQISFLPYRPDILSASFGLAYASAELPRKPAPWSPSIHPPWISVRSAPFLACSAASTSRFLQEL